MTAATRLETVQEYYFSTKLREVRALEANGKPIINLGIGSPDLKPPPSVLNAITQSLGDAAAHSYQSYQGLPALRKSIVDFYQKKYGVSLNTDSEILPLMGSKEGVLQISLAFLNDGDGVLIPNPGYPTYASVSRLVGARSIFYDLEASNSWQPDFEALEDQDLTRVKLMWVNYPHMPTGAQAQKETFKKLIAFGKKHDILIINDNPYSFILNKEPQSILQINGAKDVALELNSLSKSFNMAGWRVGMVLGNEFNISQILKVKTQMDSGMFYGIQKGAIAALNLNDDWFIAQNNEYEARRAFIWQLADALGCTYDKNATGLFVWAKIPRGFFAEDFSDKLLYNKNIFVAPGTVFGTCGEGYIRFSLCVPKELITEAISRI